MKRFGETLDYKDKETIISDNIRLFTRIKGKDALNKVTFSLENISKKPIFFRDIEVGEFFSSSHVFMNNFQSWGPCTWMEPAKFFEKISTFNMNGFVFSPIRWEFQEGIVSDYFMATDEEFFGFIESKVVHPYFLWKKGKVWIKFYVGKILKPGEKLYLGTLWFKRYDSLENALDEYAKEVADVNKPKIGKALFGWSSWYDYYLDISQEAFLDELRKAKDLKMEYELFQLDDGYESDIGDWLKTNEKFPDGLEFIAKKVKELGMIPGIWTAPFSVSESSELFKKHPDWVVTNEKGEAIVAYENWNRKVYALDTTNPNALNWLNNIFYTLKKYGFDFFKIDFLFAAMIPGKRYLDTSPVEAYRMGMNTIRKAVGKSHILGCGAPLLPSIGYVDSMRIGADTAPYWEDGMDAGQPSAKYSTRNALTRNFMNGIWWINDPDCAMARDWKEKGTTFEECVNERIVNVYVAALLNGHFMESDKLSSLSQSEIYLLKNALNFRNGKTHVKFIDAKRYVIVSHGTLNGDVVAFVNLSDRVWRIETKRFVSKREESDFFVSYSYIVRDSNLYPTVMEVRERASVKPHSIFIVLLRSKRDLKREDELRDDGRMFHYYGSDKA